MGTKLQSKPYLPGYYSMSDLNENANANSWSIFCDDKMLTNGQYYNGFTVRPVDGYSGYDKEVLKQTMLKHEATFRKQVCELHRLYRIQRDLMDELQKKELYGYSMSAEASQSNPFSSRIPSEYTPSMWQMPLSVNSSYCGPSVSGIDNRRSPSHFLKESSLRAGASPSQNGCNLKDFELMDSKCKKVPRKMFDLQLPADEYIETEDREGADKGKVVEMSLGSRDSLNKNCLIEPKSGVSLSFSASENPNCGESVWKLDSDAVNGCQSHYLTDLNEPIQGTCDEKAEASSSSNFLGQMAFHKVIQGHQMPMDPNAGIPVPQRRFFLDSQKGGDQRNDLNILHPEIEEKRSENLSDHHEFGRNNANSCRPFYCLNKLPMSMSSEPLQAEAKKAELPQFLFSDQNKKETCSREKAAYGTDNASPRVITSNYSGQVAPSVPWLLSATVDEINPSSWRNSRNNVTNCPIAIQALPFFNEPAVLNLHNKSSNLSTQGTSVAEKWDLHGCSKSSQSLLSYETSEPNPSSLQCVGFEKPKGCSPYEQNEVHGPEKFLKGFHCTDVKSAKDVHLNVYLPNELLGEEKSSQDPAMSTGREGEHGIPSGIPWLRRKPACNESASGGGSSAPLDLGHSTCSQPLSLPNIKTWPFRSGTGNLKNISLGFVPEPASTLNSKDTVSQKIKMSDSASDTKILGFPLFKNSNTSKGHSIFGSLTVHCQDQLEVHDTENDVKIRSDHLPCDHISSEMERKLDFLENPVSRMDAETSSSGRQRHCINLNFTVSSWDELSQPLEFSKADAENLTSVPRVAEKNTTGIDLEAPISIQEDSTHLEAESVTSQLETPAQVLQCERKDSQANLARVAAETIVEISAAICNNSGMANCSPSSLTESLLWFSEVISSNACDLESLVRVLRGEAEGDNESSDSGDDSFEALTLKLTETTEVEVESCNKPCQQENQKDEVMGPSPWLTRPRKRQGRRGRQRKDFQRDILPGLVTLSRHEVTEDLQMIGGLMRASGCSWQIGVVRKNTARNGWHCQARGRRRSRGSAAVAVNMVSQPQRQPSNSEVELEGINLRGWGKTTRRCRRQRFRTANFSTRLT